LDREDQSKYLLKTKFKSTLLNNKG